MLGNDNQNSNKFYILKVKTKNLEKQDVSPYFSVSEKGEDGKWKEVNQVNKVSGKLVKVDTGKRTWDEQEYDEIKLLFSDAKADEGKGEDYLLDLRLNLLSRSLINGLLSLDTFDNLSVSLYQTKKADKTYNAISLRQDDKMVNWRFKLDELPKVEKVKIGKGKEIADSTALDEFYLEQIEGLKVKVNKKAKSEPSAENASVASEDDGDSIPF